MVATAIIIPLTLHAWGPNRTLYTTAAPAGHVTFNSIVDNPAQGYEPNFMRIKDASASNSTYADSIKVEPGKEYTVFVYYHNNASSHLNESGAGIATGAYVRAEIPAIVDGNASSVAYIGATNATPTQVWDDVTLTSDSSIYMQMVAGSAHIYNRGATDGATLSDNIVTTGTPLGYDVLNGVVPGCSEYSGYVTFNIKATQSDFTIQKQVRIAGTTEWKEDVIAQPGDTLEYRIEYKNTGTTSQSNVVVKDVLPTHVTYINGSTTIKNTSNPSGKTVSDNLTGVGINIGNYTPGSNAFVKFNAKVGSVESLECGSRTLTNIARVTVGESYKQDTANVTVNKECQPDECLPGIPVGDVRCNPPKECKPGIPAGDTRCYELPHTGPVDNIVAFLGLGALIASIAYYVASRRVHA